MIQHEIDHCVMCPLKGSVICTTFPVFLLVLRTVHCPGHIFFFLTFMIAKVFDVQAAIYVKTVYILFLINVEFMVILIVCVYLDGILFGQKTSLDAFLKHLYAQNTGPQSVLFTAPPLHTKYWSSLSPLHSSTQHLYTQNTGPHSVLFTAALFMDCIPLKQYYLTLEVIWRDIIYLRWCTR